MTDKQREKMFDDIAEVHEDLVRYAQKYVGLTDPYELVSEAIDIVVNEAKRSFASYKKIRGLKGYLQRKIRGRVAALLAARQLREEGRLVDGRAERVGKKAKDPKKEVLTAIPLDAEDTGARNVALEIARLYGGSQPQLAAIINRETLEKLGAAIQMLPPTLRDYVHYRLQGMTPKKISKTTGATDRQVERWHDDAIKKLRRDLVDQDSAREDAASHARKRLRGRET